MSLILGSVSEGVKQLLDLIATVINREGDEPQVLTEAAAADLIQQEIQIALNQFELQKPIEDYLETIPTSQLNLEEIEQSFEKFLTQKIDEFTKVNSQIFSQIDRQTIKKLINNNSNLPDSEGKLLIERLENVWQKIIEHSSEKDVNTELLKYIESSNPEDLDLEKFSERNLKILNQSDTTNNVWQNLRQFDWSKIKNILLNRVDLNDLDLEEIWQKLQVFSSLNVGDNNEEELPELTTNIIKNDVEKLNSSAWYLKTERGIQEFKEVIYDPQANSEQVRSQLNEITKNDLKRFLQQREDLNLEEVEQITKALETARQEVFELLEENKPTEEIDIKELVFNYLQTINKETLLDPNLPDEIEKVLIGSGVGMVVISQFVEGWHQIDWQNLLQQRNDLEPKQLQQTTEKLSQAKNRFEKKVQQWQKEITSTSKQLQKKLESYLRYTNLELITPEAIKDKLNQLLPENPTLPRLPPIKKEKLETILAKRKGVNKSKVESIAEQIETSWQNLTTTSDPILKNIQNESVELTQNIIERVQKVVEKNLNLAQIEDDLQQLIKPELLPQILVLDWAEITEKIRENEQYSETQIKYAVKKIKQVLRKLLKMPRRWAIRRQKQLKNELEDFLSYGDKNDLTPQQIERNLEKMLDLSLGNEIIKNITQQTPEHIQQILSQRGDLNEIEIQHIGDRVNSIIRQLSDQIEQTLAQSNELLAQIKEYLNSLNLYQLDYNQIKTNLASFDFNCFNSSVIQTLKDVPVEEMSDRIGKLSYGALINLIKANKVVTEAIPDPILNQIQGVQDYVTQQIDTTKQTALDKVEALKQQTIKQAEETRQALAVATYWLFAITFTSIVSSVVAGVLATKISF